MLQPAEDKLHEALPPEMRKVYRGKRWLLFQEMATAAGDPDTRLAEDALAGVTVVGPLPRTGAFPPGPVPAKESFDSVLSRAAASQQAVVSSMGPGSDPYIDREVERITEEQEEAGLLSPPWTSLADVTKHLGPYWIPVRRFGIRQGGKVREIDDASEFGENSLVERTEKLDLLGLDEVAGVAKAWIRAVDFQNRWVEIELPCGSVLRGRWPGTGVRPVCAGWWAVRWTSPRPTSSWRVCPSRGYLRL